MALVGSKWLVTGAGGFIGHRLAEAAMQKGAVVRGLEQSEPAAARARRLGMEVVTGDVCDPAAARAACEGAELVVHTAAVVREDGPRDLYQRVNVGGTRTMAEAARAAGVRRFVQVSSVMVYGFTYPPGVTEEGPFRGEDNPYCETKIESEGVVNALHEPGRFEVTVIRPGDVYGPGSVPWVVRPFQMLKAGLFVLPDGGRGIINHVYVDNLVDGILLAIERGASGAFTLSDGVECRAIDYFRPLAHAAGRRGVRTAPAKLLRPAFRVVQKAAELVGREAPAAPSAVDYLMRPHAYSIEKARRELGFVPAVGFDEGLSRVRAWLARTYPS